MVTYNFKAIQPICGAEELIDVVLSRTQRKTPTEIHANFNIHRIRSFYMRKIKFLQAEIHERFTTIIDAFPKMNEIHPFYADLLNVLYDRDHYKLALGQLAACRNIVDNVGKEYVKQVKYADSLFRCKSLKRAAMGRMVTMLKKQGPSLEYLEQVRQHMARLPSIDPTERTIIISGMPSVGKSSFINTVSRANVDVQPYPFTTKTLLVGHTECDNLRYQVIDTPGLLDHSLEERNAIEMQAITALAHIRSTILYIVDPSEACGFSVEDQVSLFHSIRPLFANKPLLIVLNKCDLWSTEELTPENKSLIDSMNRRADGSVDENIRFFTTSTLEQTGIEEVKQLACSLIKQVKLDNILSGKSQEDILSKVHVAKPTSQPSQTFIPESVLARMNQTDEERVTTQKMLCEQNGGAGVWAQNRREHWVVENPEWANDVVPEILNGMNIPDFVDPEIEAKLAALEAEEEMMQKEFAVKFDPSIIEKYLALQASLHNAHPALNFGDGSYAEYLKKHYNPEAAAVNDTINSEGNITVREFDLTEKGINPESVEKAKKLEIKGTARFQKDGRAGETDKRVFAKMPKHLFSGKASMKRQRR